MRVAILTPVFNEEPYLSEMIQSVVAQSHRDWELIIVNDGSTDRTVEIASDWAASDSRIRVIDPPRKLGKVGAFNEAFAQSRGELIVLLGGDDILPPDSIGLRHQALAGSAEVTAAAFFALRTMSSSRKHDGIVIPKNGKGNKSGGTMILTRKLASRIFPIPTELIAEDIWIYECVRLLARDVIERGEVVLHYRIHPGNSNPRGKPFGVMREQMYRRLLPYELLLKDPPIPLSERDRSRLQALVRLSKAQYEGRVWRIVSLPHVSVVAKARALSMARPVLYGLRSRFFAFFSGR